MVACRGSTGEAPIFFTAREELGFDPRIVGTRPRVFPNTGNLRLTPVDRPFVRWSGGTLGSSGVDLWRVESTGHAIDLVSGTRWSYHVPLAGSLGLAFDRTEFAAAAGEGAILGTARRRTHVIAPPCGLFDAIVALVPGERIAAALDAEGPPADAHGTVTADADRALRSWILWLFAELSRPDSALAFSRGLTSAGVLFGDLFGEVVAAILAPTADRVRLPSLRQIQHAEAIMRAAFAEPLSIAEIAGRVGVGVRGLQLAFRRHRGQTPREVLTAIRLEAVRRRLLEPKPGETVTSIALECGLTHLGRFSRAYRATFGEPPSATLRRRG